MILDTQSDETTSLSLQISIGRWESPLYWAADSALPAPLRRIRLEPLRKGCNRATGADLLGMIFKRRSVYGRFGPVGDAGGPGSHRPSDSDRPRSIRQPNQDSTMPVP